MGCCGIWVGCGSDVLRDFEELEPNQIQDDLGDSTFSSFGLTGGFEITRDSGVTGTGLAD